MSNTAKQIEIAEPQQRVPVAQTPMDLLNQAVANGNIELAEKLMGLHERWEKNQARRAFDAAISTAKAEIPAIVRNATGHNSKRYANFAAIAHVVDPIISKHGLSYRFRTNQTDTRINVTCVLSHRDGHSEETTLAGPADNSGNKNAIQAIGSTLTYLQRYSLVQALGLAAADDDDGRAAGRGEAVSEEQAMQLREKMEAVGAPLARFLKHMKAESIAAIPASRFDEGMAALHNYKATRS